MVEIYTGIVIWDSIVVNSASQSDNIPSPNIRAINEFSRRKSALRGQ
jgi:hypothetical protein